VFDLLTAPLFLRLLVASTTLRSAQGMLFAVLANVAWGALVAAGWLGRGAESYATFIFVGPSASPGATRWVLGSAQLSHHAIAANLGVGALLVLGFAATWRSALGWSPLSDEASRRKKLGLAFLAPALLVLAQTLCLALTEVLSEP
jgi:hypothetical protein